MSQEQEGTFKQQFCPITNCTSAVLWNFFRSRTPLGSAAAAQRLQCPAASCPATLWPPAWPLTPTQPAECPIFWACPVRALTWDRLTWAVCSEGPACRQASMRTTSTWTLTERRPASPPCAWRPRSTARPYLGRHEVMNLQGSGTFHPALNHPEYLRINFEKKSKSNVCERCGQIMSYDLGYEAAMCLLWW